jgi:hypothetical protein
MEFIDHKIRSPLEAIKNYSSGNIPVVSATYLNNGISDWKDIPKDKIVSHLMSVSQTHNTVPCQAFWHPYQFSAISTVYLLKPIPEFINSSEAMLYLCQEISDRNSWRYDYARTVNLEELEVYLPVKSDGTVDFEKIIEGVQKQVIGMIPLTSGGG